MTSSTFNRPECAGWHEPDPICDGDGAGEPACSFRSQCLRVIELAGGLEARTAEKVAEVLNTHTDEELTAPASPAEALEPAGVTEEPPSAAEAPLGPATVPEPTGTPAVFAPIDTTEGGLVRTARTIYPRPSPRYDHVLPVVDAFVHQFAREVGRTLRQEGDPATRPGDIFIRWTPGMQGRAANLYEATDRGTRRHRLLTRVVMLVRDARFNLKTNIPEENFEAALNLKPPTGPDCRVWVDTKPHVALVGVDGHAARHAARWLARCFKIDIIDDVKRKAAPPLTKKRAVGS